MSTEIAKTTKGVFPPQWRLPRNLDYYPLDKILFAESKENDPFYAPISIHSPVLDAFLMQNLEVTDYTIVHANSILSTISLCESILLLMIRNLHWNDLIEEDEALEAVDMLYNTLMEHEDLIEEAITSIRAAIKLIGVAFNPVQGVSSEEFVSFIVRNCPDLTRQLYTVLVEEVLGYRLQF